MRVVSEEHGAITPSRVTRHVIAIDYAIPRDQYERLEGYTFFFRTDARDGGGTNGRTRPAVAES